MEISYPLKMHGMTRMKGTMWHLPSRKRKVHSHHSYFYKIGDYEQSTFFKNYLSNELVSLPGQQGMVSVRKLAAAQSMNRTRTIWSWFRMPLYKIEALAEQFMSSGWIQQSHHCHSLAKLKTKKELLVMGSLAMLAGTVNNFRQLPTVTNKCASDHSKIFLLVVDCMDSIFTEYIYFPKDENEFLKTMARYEELGLPGAIGSVDVVHVQRQSCPVGDFNHSKLLSV